MDVGEIGEFRLIERLRKALVAPHGDDLVIGIGDDAAVWHGREGATTIATTDTMVEGVHFLPGRVTWHDVGWKALAVNISDIAAMGGLPKYALVTLCLPPETPVEQIDALYAGLRECAENYGVTIVGGDIVSSPVLTITIALIGDADLTVGGQPQVLRRSSAQVGDLIAVTAQLGGPAGGLRALLEGTEREHPSLVEAHMRFWPRVDAGAAAIAAGIHCAIDISDGLVQDLGHICTASRVGAALYLHRIPLDDNLLLAYRHDAVMMAATGGEDYELILVGPEVAIARADAALCKHLSMDGPQLHVVGRITSGENVVRVLDEAGREIDVSNRGWDHLQREARR